MARSQAPRSRYSKPVLNRPARDAERFCRQGNRAKLAHLIDGFLRLFI
jgi:hypothetical protein